MNRIDNFRINTRQQALVKNAWSILLGLIFCLTAGAQTSYTFTNYTVSSGLPDNYIQSIVQDHRGFMWFGTKEGLSRFDGAGFRNFYAGTEGSGSSLKDNAINFLTEYKPCGLLFISSGQFTCLNTLTYRFSFPKAFESRKIYRLSKGADGKVYASAFDSCFVLNDTLGIASVLVPPTREKGNVITVQPLNDTLVLMGYIKEYFTYNKVTHRYASFNIEPALPDGQRFINFQYWDAPHGKLYFSNFYSGLLCYDLQGNLLQQWKQGALPRQLPEINVSFMDRKDDSRLWVGTYEGGLFELDERTGLIARVVSGVSGPHSSIGNTVVQCFIDRERNTWLATSTGANKINANSSVVRSWHAEFKPGGDQSNLLHVTKGADGMIYQTLFNLPYCFRIDPRTGLTTLLDTAKLPKIWCMGNMGDELLFGGIGTTVTRFDLRKNSYSVSDRLKKYFPGSELIILAHRQRNGDEWYSGNRGGGLIRIAATDGSVHAYKKDGPNGSFTISYYSHAAEDPNGDLWFAVNKTEKLLHWDHRRDHFEEFAFDSLVGSGQHVFTGISDLTIDDDHTLWLAFEGSGILSFDLKTRKAKRYLNSDGLPTNYVNSIVFDDQHRLWIGTPKGLSCFLVNDNKFLTYTVDDGLPDDDFYENCTLYDPVMDRLWIGARNTLLSFDPDSLLKVRNKKIPVYIDEVFVNGKADGTAGGQGNSFKPDLNNFQFHFIAVDLENGKDMEYAVRLEGAEESWLEVGKSNTASYANVQPGDYAFRVKARHRGDTEWEMTDEPYRFHVATPWFRTWWFRLLGFTILASLGWYLVRSYYKGKLEREKSILERQQAIEQERTRIATDMHDDFGASLSRIKFISEKIQLTHPVDPVIQGDLVKISGFSDEMAEKMNEIVWALNQRYDSLEDLISFSRAYAADYLREKNIALTFRSTIQVNRKLQGELRRNIFMVIKESLHNIGKHSGAKTAGITFREEPGVLIVRIEDDGRGIDFAGIRPFANGLENMRKRMESVGGEIAIYNEAGTVVAIRVPG